MSTHDKIIVFFCCCLSAAHVAAQKRNTAEIKIKAECHSFYADDDINLLIEFRNTSDKVWNASLPHPGELTRFPGYIFDVRKDGQTLTPSNSALGIIAFTPRTVLQPGETLLLRVPLGNVAQLPREKKGTYTIVNGGYQNALPANEKVSFVVLADDKEPQANGYSKLLLRRDWEQLIKTGTFRPRENHLLELATDEDQPPTVRRRALIAYSRVESADVIGKMLLKLAKGTDNFLAMEMAYLVDSLKSHQTVVLLELLGHKDLGVRRAAALALGRIKLDHTAVMFVLDARDREVDHLLRGALAHVLIYGPHDPEPKDEE